MSRARDLARLANENALTVDSTNNRVGVGSLTPATKLDVEGVITATSFSGSGESLTGVSGFGTALNATTGTLGNVVYKTPYSYTVSTGTSVQLDSDTTSGGVAFTRLGRVVVGEGATMTVGSGTTLAMNVLNLF